LKRFFAALRITLRPFGAIARELKTIRMLYELELSSRNPPIIRVTEKPNRKDTEVSYMGVDEKRQLHGAFEDEDDEDWA
jgi:hypothetical protein